MSFLIIPENEVPIVKIETAKNVSLYMKREDLIHPQISGNKFWKLFFNINNYLEKNFKKPLLITFGGAFSNHIAAVSELGKLAQIQTLGMIRGEELSEKIIENPTLLFAQKNGMNLRFVSREIYRNKEKLTEYLQEEFPHALIIPEGGTNSDAVKGVKMMLSNQTKEFDYLCTAVGTGGTVAGLSAYCEDNQKVLGFNVVRDDSLSEKVLKLSGKQNFSLIDASYGGYGKISNENIRFINDFKSKTDIALEPIYTGKMIQKIFEMIAEDFFPENSKILCFHTGGLQGIAGANDMLRRKNRNLIV
ncbi:1-aminocyclopropane-1-carboxylate deaminase [Chryseobacterium sp. Leaf180]|uniref:1-aminocyclopropane-1-carboxylate deaminase/D-cysteine desulfhydrase n=1 Tax=Chryseobacterium sp. Leaf180 TaxID=1736289 RepID=UPI000700F17D|nr:pyridoxal-phosphate dependent enzyme [Chryseobacterium sp. Leaf180]KQR92600.1 1-aminocyclopropane-1-carboxylate deaminase [Chryseobacterium sp. Leaf180]